MTIFAKFHILTTFFGELSSSIRPRSQKKVFPNRIAVTKIDFRVLKTYISRKQHKILYVPHVKLTLKS